MRTVAYSCNGFSAGVDTASFNGPDPLWEDVLRAHEIEPIHVLIGGYVAIPYQSSLVRRVLMIVNFASQWRSDLLRSSYERARDSSVD